MSTLNPSAAVPSVVPDAPLQVQSLQIFGLSATRRGFLNGVLGDIFQGNTTESVLKHVQTATGKLQRFGIFDEIKVYLDAPQGAPEKANVTIRVVEKPKGLFETAVGVGEHEAKVHGSVAFHNLLGGAETLSTTYTFGNKTKTAFEAALSAPLLGSPDVRVQAFVNGSIKDHSAINYYDEKSKSAGIRIHGVSSYGEHQVEYALTHRDVTGQSKSSSTVRAQTGENIKSSVLNSFVRDQRDDVAFPTTGHYLGMLTEFAGAGQRGDAHFVKHQVSGQIHHTLVGNPGDKRDHLVVFSAGFNAGALAALDNNEVHVSDRFYLGGPLSVRGFKAGGIGPRDGNDALGGEAFWSFGARLTSSIPGAAQLPVKAHAFYNAGNIMRWNTGIPVNDAVRTLAKDPRTSAGVGLVFHRDAVRIEANFCVPLQFQTGDVPRPGFQLGLGINVL